MSHDRKRVCVGRGGLVAPGLCTRSGPKGRESRHIALGHPHYQILAPIGMYHKTTGRGDLILMKKGLMSTMLLLACLAMAQVAGAATVTFAYQWGDGTPQAQGVQAALEVFHKKHPGITVEQQSGYPRDKYMAAVAGGAPPDALFVGAQYVIPDGVAGLLTPLDSMIRRAKIDMSEYIQPMVVQTQWGGHTYALPWNADINFALLRNRTLLEEGGFNPDQETRYVSEIDEVARKLTRVDADGYIHVAALFPWEAGSVANALLTWGLAFGGSFYEPEARRFTSSDPRNQAALEWMFSQKQRLLSGTVASLRQGLKAGVHEAASNRLVFALVWPQRVGPLLTAAPDLRFSLGPVPHLPDGGNINPVWVAGPTLAIPTGASHAEEAFTLIEFLTRNPQGVAAFSQMVGAIPAHMRSPYLRELAKDPVLSVFFDLTQYARFSRPPVPNQPFWTEKANAAVNGVLNGQTTPKAALEEMDRLVTEEFRKYLK